MAAGWATISRPGPQVAAGWALGLFLFPLGWLFLGLFCLAVEVFDSIFKDLIPVALKPKIIAAVIKPQGKLFAWDTGASPGPSVGYERTGTWRTAWPRRRSDIWDIKPPGQDVGGNQPVDFGVGLGEVLNGIFLERVIVFV
jgi:hypothetical protein